MFMCVCLSLKNLRDPFGNSPLDISIFCFCTNEKKKNLKMERQTTTPQKNGSGNVYAFFSSIGKCGTRPTFFFSSFFLLYPRWV